MNKVFACIKCVGRLAHTYVNIVSLDAVFVHSFAGISFSCSDLVHSVAYICHSSCFEVKYHEIKVVFFRLSLFLSLLPFFDCGLVLLF